MAYFSNGSEGIVFDDQCTKCKYGDKPCPIYAVQSLYNYDQCNNPLAKKILSTLVNDLGECEMFKMAKLDFEIDPNQLNIEL